MQVVWIQWHFIKHRWILSNEVFWTIKHLFDHSLKEGVFSDKPKITCVLLLVFYCLLQIVTLIYSQITVLQSLHEKCSNTEFFCSVFSRIQSECREIRTRKNSVFGQFSRSECCSELLKYIKTIWVCNKKVNSIWKAGWIPGCPLQRARHLRVC